MQIYTDAQAKIVVGVGVSQAATDAAELEPAAPQGTQVNPGEQEAVGKSLKTLPKLSLQK